MAKAKRILTEVQIVLDLDVEWSDNLPERERQMVEFVKTLNQEYSRLRFVVATEKETICPHCEETLSMTDGAHCDDCGGNID